MDEAGRQKFFHERFMKKVIERVPEDGKASDLALFFKVFGDPTRIKILSALLSGELRVHDICEALTMKQPAVSQQMRSLRQMRLVKPRHEGKNIYYALDDAHIEEILLMGLEHIEEKK